MNNVKNRIKRIEGVLNEEEGLTIEDIDLILSVLPTEYAKTVLNKLLEDAEREFDGVNDEQLIKLAGIGKPKSPSGLYGATLDSVLKMMPPESAEKLLSKLAIDKSKGIC